ncbi:MAG TPA: lysophospholipid acyltransferase family protein [Anaerolineales bacterium]|nr:lysophospholipid acyltransferase family protein [Anaerolineales bacterium]
MPEAMRTAIRHTLGVRLYRPPVRALFRLLYHVLTRIRIHGRENIPPRSAYLLTVNHLSYYDPPIPLSFWPYPPEALGAEETMATHPIMGRVMRWYGTWPVQRDGDDRAALRTALTILRSGLPLLIAPEGTRHPDGLCDPQPGAAFLALKTGVPLLPVGISGTADIFSSLRNGRKQLVDMVIGELYRLPDLASIPRREALLRHTDLIMRRIAALLPPHHRGDYPHPERQSD